MIIKKSNYGSLKYILNNEAMKVRNPSEEEWFCWVPEVNDIVVFPSDIEYYYEVNKGIRFIPDMLDRKTKYDWEVLPLTDKENELIHKYVRINRSLKEKREENK